MKQVNARLISIIAWILEIIFILSVSLTDICADEQVKLIAGLVILLTGTVAFTNTVRWYKYGPVFTMKSVDDE